MKTNGLKIALSIFYFFHCLISITVAGILAIINLLETYNLFLGRSTKINMSTLSYNQEVLFRVFSSIVFIVLIVMLCKAVMSEKIKAMVISVFILLTTILVMYIDFSTTLKGP